MMTQYTITVIGQQYFLFGWIEGDTHRAVAVIIGFTLNLNINIGNYQSIRGIITITKE